MADVETVTTEGLMSTAYVGVLRQEDDTSGETKVKLAVN